MHKVIDMVEQEWASLERSHLAKNVLGAFSVGFFHSRKPSLQILVRLRVIERSQVHRRAAQALGGKASDFAKGITQRLTSIGRLTG